MLTARLFLRGKEFYLVSRYDPAVHLEDSGVTVEEYQSDPLGCIDQIKRDNETAYFYFRPPALEDVALIQHDLEIAAPTEAQQAEPGAYLDSRQANAYQRAARTLVRRCFVRVEGLDIDETDLIESLGVVADEMGTYLLALIGPGEQEKKD